VEDVEEPREPRRDVEPPEGAPRVRERQGRAEGAAVGLLLVDARDRIRDAGDAERVLPRDESGAGANVVEARLEARVERAQALLPWSSAQRPDRAQRPRRERQRQVGQIAGEVRAG